MRTAIIFSFVMFTACGPEETPPAPAPATTKSATPVPSTARADAGATTEPNSTSTVPLTAAASVTRHLPGTAITTATGKYVYLVQDNGALAPFASAAIATASGYPASAIVTVSATELNCYGRNDQITTALPAPTGGKLRDGALVKEKGKTDTYIISDSVAWPVRNGNVFTAAGYDWDNVVEISAGTLAAKVEAIGSCISGVACLDEEYLATCAQDEIVGTLPTTPVVTATATTVATTAPSATATSTKTATATAASNLAAAHVTRHLPGTAITTLTGKYIYLVQDDGTAAPFATAAIAAASGYGSDTVITVSATELYCYGRGDQISAALPESESGLREGMLVKEKGKTDTYVISGGMAWPIRNGVVFVEAGYDWDNVIEISAGSLAAKVDAVGNCAAGIMCLDEAYLLTCASDTAVGISPTATSTGTTTATITATLSTTSTPTATLTAVATSTLTAASTATATTAATSTVAQTLTTTASATATSTIATSATATASATAAATVTSVGTATASTTATGTGANSGPSPPTIDLSWVWLDGGGELCLNAAYFAGDNQAVLLIWSGPGADAAKGPVAYEEGGRFCWDFAGRGKGLYYFWADVPLGSCSSDNCSRDAIANNGAMYMTAPKATPAARKWLHCESTGCDGVAYWDGSGLTPMGY